MHEIVLKKRLEQLRKKQREEAVKVQEELETALATHPRHIQDTATDNDGIDDYDEHLNSEDIIIEEYDRSMSPEPFQKLYREDRQLEILEPGKDLKELVSYQSLLPSKKNIHIYYVFI